jgi:hypothetical protein
MAGYVPSVDRNTPPLPPSQTDPTWRNDQANADKFQHQVSLAQATVANDETAVQNLQTQLNRHTGSEQQQLNLQDALIRAKGKLAHDQGQLQQAQQNAVLYQNKADLQAARDNLLSGNYFNSYDYKQVDYWQHQVDTGSGEAELSNVAHLDVAQAQVQYDSLLLEQGPQDPQSLQALQAVQQIARNDLNAAKQALAGLERQPTEYARLVWYFEHVVGQSAQDAQANAASIATATAAESATATAAGK